jgi:hypothetical protein
MDQAELQVAPWDRACSPGCLYMSATAQGTAIYRELRESERQATETLSLEPMLRDAASQEPMLGWRWRSILAILRLDRTKMGQQ